MPVRPRSKFLRRECFATAAAAVLLAGVAAFAQSTAQVSIIGRVLSAFSLQPVSVAGDTSHEVRVQPQGRESVLVLVQRATVASAPGGKVTLLLALRTNAENYQLRAAQLSGPQPLRVVLGTPQASGSGRLVAPTAVAGFLPTSNAMLEGEEKAVAAGTRISVRGSFSSPNNALLVPVELQVPPGAPAGVYQVLLRLGT
ncbi:MAG: hypothetical protein V3S55_04335 [Nitrospiraceae bacterium]